MRCTHVWNRNTKEKNEIPAIFLVTMMAYFEQIIMITLTGGLFVSREHVRNTPFLNLATIISLPAGRKMRPTRTTKWMHDCCSDTEPTNPTFYAFEIFISLR